jgi:hypothetical protein
MYFILIGLRIAEMVNGILYELNKKFDYSIPIYTFAAVYITNLIIILNILIFKFNYDTQKI